VSPSLPPLPARWRAVAAGGGTPPPLPRTSMPHTVATSVPLPRRHTTPCRSRFPSGEPAYQNSDPTRRPGPPGGPARRLPPPPGGREARGDCGSGPWPRPLPLSRRRDRHPNPRHCRPSGRPGRPKESRAGAVAPEEKPDGGVPPPSRRPGVAALSRLRSMRYRGSPRSFTVKAGIPASHTAAGHVRGLRGRPPRILLLLLSGSSGLPARRPANQDAAAPRPEPGRAAAAGESNCRIPVDIEFPSYLSPPDRPCADISASRGR